MRGGDYGLAPAHGLDKLDSITGKFTHYRHDPNNARSLSADGLNNSVKFVGPDKTGALWVQTTAGLDRFDPRTGEATHYPELRSSSEYDYYQISQDRSGLLWIFSGLDANSTGPILSSEDGLATFEPEKRKLTHYRLRLADPGLAETSDVNRVDAMLEDEDGVLWLGTKGNGLIKFDRKHEKLTRYRNDPEDRQSLSNNWVHCLFEDREGNIWAGTGGGGVNRFSRRPLPFTVYRNDSRSSKRINQNFVLSVYEDSQSVLWVGNDSVLNAIDQKRGRVTTYRNNPSKQNSISDGTVLSAIERPSGTLWFGTYRSGLNRFDRGTGIFKSYRHRSADPNSISSDIIFRLFIDHRGRFWIETGEGLDRFDPNTEHFTRYSAGFDNSSAFRAIAEDQQGTLWLGTYDDGVYRFDPDKRQSRAYKYDPNTPGSLSSNHVNATYVDTSGTVWIGTQRGLNRFSGGNSFTAYFRSDGLADNDVRGILEDAAGNLWISTNNGLSKFNPATKTFSNYHGEDGLAGSEFNFWGVPFRSAHGELFFPGVEGLTALSPENVIDNPYIPPVVLTDFRLFNETVPVGGHSPLKKTISYTDALDLSHRDSVISFEFSALSYVASAANRYRYKLDRLETRWNDVSSAHRYATYTTLPPGEYVFRVQGSNNRGLWNERGASIRIRILPPWWSTGWFRAIVGVSLLLSLWLLYFLRIKTVEGEFNMRLEERVGERMRIARDLHDTLLQSFHGLLLRFQAVHNLLPGRAAAAKEVLESALDDAAQAITEARDAVQDLRGSRDIGGSLAQTIEALGRQMAQDRTVEDQEPPAFSVEVEGAAHDLHPILRDEVYRITGEALRNAFRHARARRIEVEIRYEAQKFRTRVRDDGIGVDESVLHSGRAGHWGLPGMRERAKGIGGQLEVWSEQGAGTEVELTIPASVAYGSNAVRRFRLFRSKVGTNS